MEAVENNAFQRAHKISTNLVESLSNVIRGRRDTIELVIAALIADGHVLLEDYPGSGKTTLAKTLGGLIASDSQNASGAATDNPILGFRRIQFTPDMLPGDVLGVNVFDPKTGQFNFLHGPVFAHIVLADEINRTGPKVQSAFLECMAEKQVTIDNTTRPLDELFFVLGTQNPLDLAGTYPLPQVQLDRFLFKLPMSYVDAETELGILEDIRVIHRASTHIVPVCTRQEVLAARTVCQEVHVATSLQQAIVDTVQATRNNPMIQYGASTRAALMLQRGIRAWALLKGRDYATPDDLRTVAPFVLLHRLKFHAGVGEAPLALEELMRPAMEKAIATSIQ